jgi:hypothetical protein
MRNSTGPLALVPLFLLENEAVSHGAIRLWALLYAKFSYAETTVDYEPPSRAEMAVLLGQSTDSVDRYIKQLQKAGVMRVLPQSTTSAKRVPNSYELLITHPTSIHAATPPAPVHPVQEGLTLLEKGQLAEGGGVSPEVYAREREKKSVRTSTSKKYVRWTQFWARYPRKHQKADALRVWIKLGAEQDETLFLAIMVGLRKYVAVWQREQREQRFIPYATRFLNSKQWEDALDEEPLVEAASLSKQTQAMASSTRRFLERHEGGK